MLGIQSVECLETKASVGEPGQSELVVAEQDESTTSPGLRRPILDSGQGPHRPSGAK